MIIRHFSSIPKEMRAILKYYVKNLLDLIMFHSYVFLDAMCKIRFSWLL